MMRGGRGEGEEEEERGKIMEEEGGGLADVAAGYEKMSCPGRPGPGGRRRRLRSYEQSWPRNEEQSVDEVEEL